MNSKITYNDFVDALSRRTGQPKNKSDQFIKSLINLVTDELKETGRSGITNLGAFKVVEMTEREGVNPHTGESMTIPAGKRISFSAFKALKEQVNEDMGDQDIQIPDEEHSEPIEVNEPEDTIAEAETEDVALETANKEEELKEDIKTEKTEAASESDHIRISVSSRSNQEIFESQLSSEEKNKDLKKEKARSTEYIPPSKRKEAKPESGNGKAYLIAAIIFVLSFAAYAVYYFTQPTQTTPPQTLTTQAAQVTDDTAADNAPPLSASEQISESTEDDVEETAAGSEDIPQEEIQQPVNTVAVADETDVSNDYEVHVVSEGEWLYRIAENTYGMARFWPLILQANQDLISDPDIVYPAMEISIPPLSGENGVPNLDDYQRLSEASLVVADRYEEYGQDNTAQEYRDFSRYYAMIANGELAAF